MLSILGLIVIIVASVHVYRTAKQYERNAVAWTLITLAVGLGIQLILPLFILIIVGIIMVTGGSSPEEIQAAISVPAIIISIVCIVLSVVGVFLILRHLSKIPEEESFTKPPSPPETFN